jgi:arylsulfatase A-like enzyme
MVMRTFLALAGLAGWAAAVPATAGTAAAVAPAAARKPNVIVIVADDMGYADLGVTGCRDIPTPHIDSLAANGVRCTNGYVSHPFCSPTRAGLMTGKYQQRFGHEFNPGPATDRTPGVGLPLDQVTMADRMRSAGYRTGLVGKWHLGHTEDAYHPLNRGFDEFFGFLGGSHSYVKSGTGHIAILRGREEVQERAYLTDAFAREGVAFIERHKAEPFFLHWAFNAVHGPMDAADRYKERFAKIEDPKRRTYATMLAALDDAVGAGLAKLREAGIEDDTLIFFVSDNGGPEAVNASDNGPFRGVKGQATEGGVRVPFLVQWKRGLPAGKSYDHPVICLDILPTALAAAGAPAGPDAKFDGVDLMPHLRGENAAPPHDALYWRSGGEWAIRAGDWKLVRTIERGKGTAGDDPGPRTRQKLSPDGAQLYNLKDDVGETNDLTASNPAKAKELAAAWQAWSGQMKEPLWRPPDRARKRGGKAAKGEKD